MKNLKNSMLAYGAMLLYAVTVGFTFLFVKNGINVSGSSLVLLFWRFTVAMITAVCLKLAGVIKIDPRGGNIAVLLLTAFTYAGFLGFQAWGLQYTTSIISGIIFALVPVLAAVASRIILGEKTNKLQNAFAALCMSAVILMFLIGGIGELKNASPKGIFLVLLSSVSIAVSNVLMRVAKKDYKPFTVSFYGCAAGFFLFWSLMIRSLLLGRITFTEVLKPLLSPGFDLGVLYLGILCTFCTGAMSAYALRTLPAMSATVFGNLSTAISVVAGALILKEPLHLYQIICTCGIIIGVLGIAFSTKVTLDPGRKQEEHKDGN